MAETQGYVLAHCLLSKRVNLGKLQASEAVLF